MVSKTMTDTTLHLTFRFDNELLALDISQVREVLDLQSITMVPKNLEYIRGVINLRGNVIPVVDLRLKFDMSKTESTICSRIVVIEIDMDGAEIVLGILADSVHDVIEIVSDQIDSTPDMGKQWRTEFVKGIGKHEDNFILLADINRIFSAEDLSFVESAKTNQGNTFDRVN